MITEASPSAIVAWESFYVIVGSMAVLLLFIGIHNAWDSVTFIVVERSNKTDKSTSD